MLATLFLLILILDILIGSAVMLCLWAAAEFKLKEVLSKMKAFVISLFTDKNIFGLSFSGFICIILVPWLLPFSFSLVIYGIIRGFKFLWKLGCK